MKPWEIVRWGAILGREGRWLLSWERDKKEWNIYREDGWLTDGSESVVTEEAWEDWKSGKGGKGKRTRLWGQDDGKRVRKGEVGRSYMKRREETSIIFCENWGGYSAGWEERGGR
jgi:hypothetical protein